MCEVLGPPRCCESRRDGEENRSSGGSRRAAGRARQPRPLLSSVQTAGQGGCVGPHRTTVFSMAMAESLAWPSVCSLDRSTHSLPPPRSTVRRFPSSGSAASLQRSGRKLASQYSQAELDTVRNVCNFVNNNAEDGLLDLPGLRIKSRSRKAIYCRQRSTKSLQQSTTTAPALPARSSAPFLAPVPYPTPNQNSNLTSTLPVHIPAPAPAAVSAPAPATVPAPAPARVVRVELEPGRSVELNLRVGSGPRLAELLRVALARLDLPSHHASSFCLCVKLAGEFCLAGELPSTAEDTTLYLRLTRPPPPSLNTLVRFSVQNCGNFCYAGRLNKARGSRAVPVVVNSSGAEVSCQFLSWSQVRQLSYTNTFIQILYAHKNTTIRKKICFDAEKIKLIYDLMMMFWTRMREAAEEDKENLAPAPAGAPADTRLEQLCRRLCARTVHAVRSISTPRRRRARSSDPQRRPGKRVTPPQHARSLSAAELGRVRRHILLDPAPAPAPVLSPGKRKSEDDAGGRAKRTRILTNPRPGTATTPGSHQLSSGEERTGTAPARTPVRMGVKSKSCKAGTEPSLGGSETRPGHRPGQQLVTTLASNNLVVCRKS